MSNEDNDNGPGSLDLEPSKLLRQIIAKLQDWAALSTLALFMLAVPAGWAMQDFKLSFAAAFLFSLLIVLLRAYKIHSDNQINAIKLDNDCVAKVASIEKAHELKMLRLKLKAMGRSLGAKRGRGKPSEEQLLLLPPRDNPTPPRNKRRRGDRQ